MTSMRNTLAGLAVLAVACAPTAPAPTTTSIGPTESTSGTTTTTEFTQPFEVDDCSSPPVSFSSLCEVFDLIQRWHVDRPIEALPLADLAVQALLEFEPIDTEPRPRSLVCAIPHEDFVTFCAELARLVGESEIVVADAVDKAVLVMADVGLDPFSYYVPPDQVGVYRENGIVGGVGVLLDTTDAVGSRCARIAGNCPLLIVFVLEDNPGAVAGLQAGDRIVAIDGKPVEGLGFTTAATAIAGDETGSVQLTVEREGQTLDFDISRSELTVPTVEVRLPQPGVGYLRIPDFDTDIPGLVAEGLEVLLEARPDTIIIDLRDNPGGFIDAAVEVASKFIDGGVVLVTAGPDANQEFEAEEGGLATTERLIVLVNQGTASAAEILAGALRDRRGAVVIGNPTFGKDAVQIPFDLRNGGELFVTVARWSTPAGLTAGDGGLIPDRDLELSPSLTVEEIVSAVLVAAS